MKKLYYILFIFILFLCGCKKDLTCKCFDTTDNKEKLILGCSVKTCTELEDDKYLNCKEI